MGKWIQGITLSTTFALTTPLYAATSCPPHPTFKDCETEVNTNYTQCNRNAKASVDLKLGNMQPRPPQNVIDSMYHEAFAPCSQEHKSGIRHCEITCTQ